MTNPDVLVYLDASLETIRRRRQGDWDEEWLAEENRRLAHARAHCHLYLPTDHLTVEEVVEREVQYLESPPYQGNGRKRRSPATVPTEEYLCTIVRQELRGSEL